MFPANEYLVILYFSRTRFPYIAAHNKVERQYGPAKIVSSTHQISPTVVIAHQAKRVLGLSDCVHQRLAEFDLFVLD